MGVDSVAWVEAATLWGCSCEAFVCETLPKAIRDSFEFPTVLGTVEARQLMPVGGPWDGLMFATLRNI